MNIDQQYIKASNQYWHENMGWTLCSVLLPPRFRGWVTCDTVVTWFSNPKRKAGTYLRAARVPMATTEVWCHRLAEHVFTSDCIETLSLLNVTYTLSFIIVSRLWRLSPGLAVRPTLTRPLSDSRMITAGVIYSPAQKSVIIPDLFVREFFYQKLKVADEMADVDHWYFSKSRHVRKASLNLIP